MEDELLPFVKALNKVGQLLVYKYNNKGLDRKSLASALSDNKAQIYNDFR